MTEPILSEALVLLDGQEKKAASMQVSCGEVALFSRACPTRNGGNEDALAVVPCGENRVVLAVADGFGGQPSGNEASRLAVEAIVTGVNACMNSQQELREGILNGFEKANQAVVNLGIGAATTLAVAEIDQRTVRPYHAGDSEIVVVGQRGKIKLQTVSHSPVGYGIEAGLIRQDDALHHDERNLVSNMVGSAEMRIEIGSPIRLGKRDTVLLGTDGLFDNLEFSEIVDMVRKGKIGNCSKMLVDACTSRMLHPKTGQPSKPDDLAFILFRRN